MLSRTSRRARYPAHLPAHVVAWLAACIPQAAAGLKPLQALRCATEAGARPQCTNPQCTDQFSSAHNFKHVPCRTVETKARCDVAARPDLCILTSTMTTRPDAASGDKSLAAAQASSRPAYVLHNTPPRTSGRPPKSHRCLLHSPPHPTAGVATAVEQVAVDAANTATVGLYFVREHVQQCLPTVLQARSQLQRTAAAAADSCYAANHSREFGHTMRHALPASLHRLEASLRDASWAATEIARRRKEQQSAGASSPLRSWVPHRLKGLWAGSGASDGSNSMYEP